MCLLATGPWANKPDECDRILWCVTKCDEYFKGDGLQTLLLKDLRRRDHTMPTILPLSLLPVSEGGVADIVRCFNARKWSLLDVGSCYNPFVQFPQFDVTAIDIAPANQVYRSSSQVVFPHLYPVTTHTHTHTQTHTHTII